MALIGGMSACAASASDDPNAITVGLLLPFTGNTSATASNFERSMLYAADRVNSRGGVKGRKIRVLSADTHSDLDHAKESANFLVASGAVAVVGPESSEIADGIAPILAADPAHQVAFLSPLIGAANDTSVDCTHPWYRLAPSARSLGEALAKLVYTETVSSTAVLYAAGDYDEALSMAASARFTQLGGNTALVLQLDPDAQSYADQVRQAVAANVDSVILATSPRTAAHVINEFQISSGKKLRWFLSPLLKTQLLVENVVPGALEGALGVTPKIYDTSTAFPDAFDKTWAGDQPLEGAYFYYDAMALLSFALEKSLPSTLGAPISRDDFFAAIHTAAAPPGEAAGWNDIEVGMNRLSGGTAIYYSGLTGPLLLDDCGSRQLGATTTWQVKDGTIAARDTN